MGDPTSKRDTSPNPSTHPPPPKVPPKVPPKPALKPVPNTKTTNSDDHIHDKNINTKSKNHAVPAATQQQESTSTYQIPGPAFNHRVANFPGGLSHNTLPVVQPYANQIPGFAPQVQAPVYQSAPYTNFSTISYIPVSTYCNMSETQSPSYQTPNLQPGAQNFTEQPVPGISNGPMEHQWHPRFDAPQAQVLAPGSQPVQMLGVPLQQVIYYQILPVQGSVPVLLAAHCQRDMPITQALRLYIHLFDGKVSPQALFFQAISLGYAASAPTVLLIQPIPITYQVVREAANAVVLPQGPWNVWNASEIRYTGAPARLETRRTPTCLGQHDIGLRILLDLCPILLTYFQLRICANFYSNE